MVNPTAVALKRQVHDQLLFVVLAIKRDVGCSWFIGFYCWNASDNFWIYPSHRKCTYSALSLPILHYAVFWSCMHAYKIMLHAQTEPS